MNVPEVLRPVYRNLLASRARLPLALSQKLSATFIPACSEEFESSKFRLIYVGQETFGWDDPLASQARDDDPLAGPTGSYSEFDFANGSYEHTPFWQFQRAILRELGEGSFRACLWSNLYRADANGSVEWSGLSSEEIAEVRTWQRGVLAAEIEATKTRAAVFVTGPWYDDVLRDQLSDMTFEPLENPFGLGVRQLARVGHPLLPRSSFRTYHPRYLRTRGWWGMAAMLAELIKSEARQS